MKILYSMIYPPDRGGSGAPIYTLHLLEGTIDRGLEGGILFSTGHDYRVPRARYESLPLRFERPAIFDSQPSVPQSIAFRDLTRAQVGELVSAFVDGFRRAWAAGYTLSHVQHGMYIGYAAHLAKRELGLPYVVSLHVMELNFIHEFPDPIMAMAGMVHADRIIALTDANKRRLLQIYTRENILRWDMARHRRTREQAEAEYDAVVGPQDIDPARVCVIPLGIDMKRYDIRHDAALSSELASLGIPDEAPLVLFAGRLIEMKGILHLLDAARHYTTRCNAHTIVLGGGALTDQVRQRCAEQSNVHYLGFKTQEELPAYYEYCARRNSVFCVPSRSEGLSLAYLEAMACGMRVMASCFEDMGEMDIMAPPWVSFVPFGDVEGLAQEMSRVLGASASDYRQHIRRRVSGYDKERFIARVHALYDAVDRTEDSPAAGQIAAQA
ncbi:MAG TPA: glycosyltransferase family 4 protein [Polyangiaceae bacterium]|nr:glycosyltransferase family 4 protein [Polyangiaceae bacterium]